MTPAFRGTNQIRTGVNGFADRYLTTRTWYPFAFAIAKLVFFYHFSKFIFNFIKKLQLSFLEMPYYIAGSPKYLNAVYCFVIWS